jgi:hypothetical protein
LNHSRKKNNFFYLLPWPFTLQQLFSFQNGYKTAITVLLGEPSPDLFIAMMRYLSSVFSDCSTKVDSVSIAVATSCQRCGTPDFVSPATLGYAVTGIILMIVVKSKANRSRQPPINRDFPLRPDGLRGTGRSK